MKKLILVCTFLLAIAPALHAEETLIQKQITSCEHIGYPQWRDDCFETLPKDAKSYAVCLKFTSKERREKCFKANPPGSETDCLQNKTAAASDECLILLKEAQRELSYCMKVSDPSLQKECYGCPANTKDTNICLEFMAKQTQNKSLCDLIDNKPGKASCISTLLSTATVEGCENPQTLQEYKQCKQFAIAQKEEMKSVKVTKTKQRTAKVKPIKAAVKVPAETVKAEKAAQAQEAKHVLAQEKAAKLQQAKDEKAAKLQQAKEAREAKAQEQAAKLQQANDQKEQMKAEKIQKAREAKETIERAKAERIQKANDEKEARAKEHAEKVQKAKEEKLAKAAPKVEVPLEVVQPVVAEQPVVEEKPVEVTETVPTVEQPVAEEKAQEVQQVAPEQPQKTKAQEKAEKLQQEKEAKAQEQAARLQKAKEAKEAIAQEKAAKLEKAKQEKATKAQEQAEKIRKEKESKAAAKAQKKQPDTTIKPSQKSREVPDRTKAAAPTLEIVGFGCTVGFGAWVDPPKKKHEEIACDKENIQQFLTLLNHCTTAEHEIKILSFDMNKDGCVTCYDFKLWQKQLATLYKARKRSTDGRSLEIKECRERKF